MYPYFEIGQWVRGISKIVPPSLFASILLMQLVASVAQMLVLLGDGLDIDQEIHKIRDYQNEIHEIIYLSKSFIS